MKKRLSILSVSIIMMLFIPYQAVSLETENYKKVKKFVTVFKKGDKSEIVKYFNYPIYRTYPIHKIKSEKEFLDRYDEVFDSNLSNLIKKSDISKFWSELGWRGIMFRHGTIWMNYEGKIESIHYMSDVEKNIKIKIINDIKKTLHKSLKVFKEPVLHWTTKHYRVRIDDLGEFNYRYAAWPINKDPDEKPSLVLFNGEMINDGNGGNHYYEF